MNRLTFIMLALLAIAGRVSAQESVSVNDVTVPQGGEALVEINYSLEGTDPYVGFFFQVDLPESLSLVEGADEGYPWYDPDVEAIKKLSITTTATGFAATPKTAEATINGTSGVLMRFKVAADENLEVGSKLTATLKEVLFNVRDENFNVTRVELDNVSFDVIVVSPTATMGDPIEAIAIDNINTYTGSEPYVYSKANMTYYALNSLGEYEEYGIVEEVNTLKVAGDAITEIEYIKSTNNAYINLNYIPKANSKAICTINAETGNDWKAIYGCGYNQNGWKDRFCFFTTNATINLGGETGNREAMAYGRKIVTVLDAVAGKMDIFEADGTTLIGTITDSPKTADCKTPLYVFAQNKDVPSGGKQTDCYNMLTKLYGLQLFEGEALVMDLVPAVNSEGKGGLKDKLTGTFYGSANSADFELSADGQAMAGQAGIPVYEGKRVKLTTDNHEYKYQDGQWLDCGEMALEEITDQTYKDMRNWETNNNHMSIFAGFTYDGTTNEINPYVGTGGFEPYMFKIETIAGEDYNWSFIYSGSAYGSWHSTEFHAYVANDYNLNTTETGAYYNDNVIGIAEAFPFAGVENKPYSIDFTAKQNNETLVVQFGDVDDGKEFWFKFANLKVSRYVYPLAYEPIDFVVQDDNKYTPLAYIESTSAARENSFTLPYIPVTATQIDTKFQVYDTSSGWCGIFSARNTYAGTGISLYMNNDRAHFGYFTGSTTGAGDNFAPFSLNTDYEVQADVTKLVVNGETYETGNTVTNATTRQLSLFANPEWDNPMRGRFYYCKISEAGEVIYDFKPVMRHDGVFGFYDRQTATFVQPAKGNWDGYGFAKLDDQAYVIYNTETRIVMVGSTAQYLPETQNLEDATFTWTSSDPSIATVAADGTVTGLKAGKVTITATTDADQGWTASYELTVSEPTYARFDAKKVGYAIVIGGNGWGDSSLAALVDNDATTKFGTSGVDDAWAIIIASEPVAVKQYSIVTGADTYNYPSRNPVSWKLEGSNDNQTWTLIDEKVQTYQLQAKNKEEFVFPVNGEEAFKFFKFSATQLADGFQLGEFWINEQAHVWGEPTETPATCTTPGKKEWVCEDCGALKTEVLPVIAHTYADGACTVCGTPESIVVFLPTRGNDNTPYYAKFRHANKVSEDEYVDIEEGWTTAEFDDTAWDELMMPLGSFGPYHTRWVNDYNTFWFRRDFYIDNPAKYTKLTLKVTHDDDCAVFLNGTKVWNEFGWTGGENDWRLIDVDPSLLVEGNNVLAMYIEQNWGGAYCDFGLEGVKKTTDTVTKVLTLTATGNGTIQYGNTSVRSSTQSFDVAELSDVVLTITPDAGHHVETLTINGEDALSHLTDDGKLPLTRPAAIGTWTFDNPSDLLAGTGIATLQATTHAKGIVTVTDLATAGITSVNGPDADNGAVNVPIGSSLLMAANNNATSMGSYSIMYDVSVEDGSPWIPLLQNSLTDSKDASLFIHNNAVGLGSLGYHGSIENGKWYRIVFVVEPNGASLYVDGIQVASDLNLTAAYNQHWLLKTGALFFADEDGEETAIKISELRFWDVALTADEVGMLGACGNVASSYGGMTSSVTVAVTFANNSDLNDDGLVDVSDIMTIINNIADDIYLAAADLNNDGFVDVGDIMVVINAIIGIHDNTAGVKAMRDVTNLMPATENDDYLTISNEDNIVSIQLDNEYEYSAFQMLVTLLDGVDIDDVIFNSDRLNGFTQFARKVNERQYIIIGFSMDGNVISGSAGKILSLSITGNADDNIIISDPIFSIPDAKSYKLRVDNSFTTNLQDIQVAQISVIGNTVYVHANNDTMLNIYSVSGALCERKHLHPGVNAIALRPGQYIINNRKVTITK